MVEAGTVHPYTDLEDGNLPTVTLTTTDPASHLITLAHTGFDLTALDFVRSAGTELAADGLHVSITIPITDGSVKTNSRTPKPISGSVHVFDLVIESADADGSNGIEFMNLALVMGGSLIEGLSGKGLEADGSETGLCT